MAIAGHADHAQRAAPHGRRGVRALLPPAVRHRTPRGPRSTSRASWTTRSTGLEAASVVVVAWAHARRGRGPRGGGRRAGLQVEVRVLLLLRVRLLLALAGIIRHYQEPAGLSKHKQAIAGVSWQ
jgi:hypothetical protein